MSQIQRSSNQSQTTRVRDMVLTFLLGLILIVSHTLDFNSESQSLNFNSQANYSKTYLGIAKPHVTVKPEVIVKPDVIASNNVTTPQGRIIL